MSTSYARVTFACRPNFPEARFTGLMLSSVNIGR